MNSAFLYLLKTPIFPLFLFCKLLILGREGISGDEAAFLLSIIGISNTVISQSELSMRLTDQ